MEVEYPSATLLPSHHGPGDKTSPMAIHILSADPDFRRLLEFFLQVHGFAFMSDAAPLVLVDLAHEDEADSGLLARVQTWPGATLVVLAQPGEALAAARRLLPDAAVYLPV